MHGFGHRGVLLVLKKKKGFTLFDKPFYTSEVITGALRPVFRLG